MAGRPQDREREPLALEARRFAPPGQRDPARLRLPLHHDPLRTLPIAPSWQCGRKEPAPLLAPHGTDSSLPSPFHDVSDRIIEPVDEWGTEMDINLTRPMARGNGRAWSAMLLALVFTASLRLEAAEPPNIVYVLADDLGWNDVGFRGGRIRTPTLDRLAAGGAIFNALYSQPYSTQTRAALLTGRYPMRYGLQTLSLEPSSRYGLPTEERTLPQALKASGYRTAFLGHWLLGHARREHWPGQRGFDLFYGSLSGDVDPQLRKNASADWYRNDRHVKEEGYVTDLLAREAARIISAHDRSAPLFLMAAFNTPAQFHGVPKPYLDPYRNVPDDARRGYAAAVTALDSAVGSIVAALDKRGMLDNTLIVFHSDNGGAVPLRYITGDRDIDRPAADNGSNREGRAACTRGGCGSSHWHRGLAGSRPERS